MFEGLSVAMVTPFNGGAIDTGAVDRLLDHLMSGGVDGIVPAGTTGEGPTVSAAERLDLFTRVKQRADGAFVLAGTGSNSTAITVEQTLQARDAGVDGALVVAPYYNKPTQQGLVAHFTRTAAASGIPICMYNVPGRTGVSISVDTVVALAGVANIVAIKEASGSLDQVTEIVGSTGLTVLSGDDSLTLPMLAVGAAGVVSVIGNVVPGPLKWMLTAFRDGRLDEARSLHHQLYPLARALFVESNPGPVKHALARLGLINEELRLPLAPVSRESAEKIDGALRALPAEWLPKGIRLS